MVQRRCSVKRKMETLATETLVQRIERREPRMTQRVIRVQPKLIVRERRGALVLGRAADQTARPLLADGNRIGQLALTTPLRFRNARANFPRSPVDEPPRCVCVCWEVVTLAAPQCAVAVTARLAGRSRSASILGCGRSDGITRYESVPILMG